MHFYLPLLTHSPSSSHCRQVAPPQGTWGLELWNKNPEDDNRNWLNMCWYKIFSVRSYIKCSVSHSQCVQLLSLFVDCLNYFWRKDILRLVHNTMNSNLQTKDVTFLEIHCIYYHLSRKVIVNPVNVLPEVRVRRDHQPGSVWLLVEPGYCSHVNIIHWPCTDLSSPRPPPTVAARQIRMAVQGWEATRQPYQEKNLSRELITPLEHQRTAK